MSSPHSASNSRRCPHERGTFADKTGTATRTYQGYEGGEREPSLAFAIALLDNYRIDPVWLVRGSDAAPKVRLEPDAKADLAVGLFDAWRKALSAIATLPDGATQEHFFRLLARQTFRHGTIPHDLIADFIDVQSGR